MGNHGHAYARLRQALLTGNLTIVDAAARDLPHVDLADALKILRLMADKRDPRYERAAARWAARAAHERRLDLERNRRMLALLDVMALAPEGVELRLRDLLQL